MPVERPKPKSVSQAAIPTIPELERAKTAALNTLVSVHSCRAYKHAMDEFIAWYCSEPRLGLNRVVVLRYLVPKKIDQVPHLRCQVEVGVLKNFGQRGPQLCWSLRENQASLEQECTQLVDDRSASGDQTIANSMDGLQIELVVGLDRNKAHILPFHGLGDRLCIHEVVLVGLYERLHKLSCNQTHIVALLPQRASKKMRSRTCLQPDQRRLHVGGVRQQLSLRELLPHQHVANCAERYEMKRRLAKIDANRN